jgi:hypothetical protein
VSTVELHRPPFWRAVRITFEAVWKHWSACILLGLVAAALTAVPGVLFGLFAPKTDLLRLSAAQALTIAAFAAAGLVSLALAVFVVFPPTIGGLSLVGTAAVAAEPVNTADLLRVAVDRAIPAIGAFFGVFLLVAAPPLALAVIAALVRTAVGLAPAIPVVVLFFVSCVLSVPLAVRTSLAVPVVMAEDAGPAEAIGRSWRLTRGAVWWALGVYVVIGLVAAAVSGLLGAQFVTGRIAGPGEFVIAAIRNAVAIMVVLALGGVASGVVYASREVPPDDGRTTPEPRRRLEQRPIPVPIPLHAFDPPPTRE